MEFFIPNSLRSILKSELVSQLAEIAKNSQCLDRLNSSDDNKREIALLAAHNSGVWRAFPQTTLSDVLRGRSAFNISLDDLVVERQLLQRVAASLSLRDFFRVLDQESLGVGASYPLRFEARNYSYGPELKTSLQHVSPPSVAENFLWELRRTKMSQLPYVRLAQIFLVSITFLMVHPFRDCNGRISRLMINALGTERVGKPLPLSIFYLLQDGRYLYSQLCPKLMRGEIAGLAEYFSRCCERACMFAEQASQRDMTAPTAKNSFELWNGGGMQACWADGQFLAREADELLSTIYRSSAY